MAAAIIWMLGASPAHAATLTIVWKAQSEAAGYRIDYGTEPGVYQWSMDAGNTTSIEIRDLKDGTVYFFAVRAYDAAATLSAPVQEVTGVTFGQALGALPPPSLTLTCPVPSATSPDGAPVTVTFAPTVNGGAAPVTTSCSPASGSLFPVGTTSFSCTAVDALRETASCASLVTVAPPPPAPPLSITCPAPTATSTDGKPVAVTFSPSVSGGTAPISTSCSPASGSLFPVGSTSFTCKAIDARQQTAACSSAVIVQSSAPVPTPDPAPKPQPAPSQPAPTPPADPTPATPTEPLKIACPVVPPVTAPGNSGKAVVRFDGPRVTGAAGAATSQCSPASGSLFTIGTTSVACEAIDSLKRVAVCTTPVTVLAPPDPGSGHRPSPENGNAPSPGNGREPRS